MEIAVCPAVVTDMPYIHQTWIRSYKSAPHCRRMEIADYWCGQTVVIQRCLLESNVLVARMAGEDAPDTILGWACFAGDVLHYVYVRKAFRNHGVASQLLAEAGNPGRASHRTPDLRYLGWVEYDESLRDGSAQQAPPGYDGSFHRYRGN